MKRPDSETENRMVVTSGWRTGKNGEMLVKSTDFQLEVE